MASEGADAERRAPDAKGVSEFVTDILKQLNVSAWLPAAMFVCNIAVIYQLHHLQGASLDVGAAITKITSTQWALLAVIPASLILAAMVVQAFAFESIRVLEGYWSSRWVLRPWRRVCVWRHKWDLGRAHKLKKRWERRAFERSRPALKEQLTPRLELLLTTKFYKPKDLEDTNKFTPDDVREAAEYDWHDYAPPYYLRQVESVEQVLNSYPGDYARILPTKLGNVLRRYEDALQAVPDSGLEEYVTSHLDLIPPLLLQQHDEHRTKLDMYCTLVFVFTTLGAISATLVWHAPTEVPAILGMTCGYVALAWLSYRAAISSAHGYGSVLRAIDNVLVERSDVTALAQVSSPGPGDSGTAGR